MQKTIEEVTDHEVGKLLNYLKVTSSQVGLLIDFKHPKLATALNIILSRFECHVAIQLRDGDGDAE